MSTNLPPRKTDCDEGSPESDKDQYSLDEMLKALREKEREKEEKGEIVTRSDGSLARKVKKRRRRTEQPEKVTPEKEKKRLMVRVVMGAVLLLLLLLTGVFLIVHQNSKGFREGLEEKVSGWTGAEVELGGLKRLPLSCQINVARFKWDDDYFVRELKVSKVSGDVGFSSFFGVRPGGLQIGGKTGQMILQTPSGKWGEMELKDEDEFPFGFAQYYCESLDVAFGEGGPVGIRDASVILSHEGLEGYQVTIDEGFLQLAGWEDFPISSGLMRFKEGGLEIKTLSLEHAKADALALASNLELSGAIPLEPGKQVELAVRTERFPLKDLVGKQLGRFLSGSVIGSSGKVVFTLGQGDLDEIKIDFEGNAARMSGFPFLEQLENLFPDEGFEQLEFNEGISQTQLSGTLRVRPGGMALEKLEMARKGIRLEGGMIIGADEQIRGVLRMSLNRVYFLGHPKLKNSPLLAGSEKDGYVTVEFELGGTVKRPGDNFMVKIGVDRAEISPESGRNGGDDLWERLQQPDVPGE